MVAHITNIDRITRNELKTVSISFDSIARQLIKLMNPSSNKLPIELSLVSLKLFRKIIEKENLDIHKPAADWETKDYIIY